MPPFRHISDTGENVAHLGAGALETHRGVHHEIRAAALFRIRHLPRQDAGQPLFAGAARQDALRRQEGPLSFALTPVAAPTGVVVTWPPGTP